MTVGKNGGGVRNLTPDAGNGDVDVRDITASGRNGCICVSCVYCECLREQEVS